MAMVFEYSTFEMEAMEWSEESVDDISMSI